MPGIIQNKNIRTKGKYMKANVTGYAPFAPFFEIWL